MNPIVLLRLLVCLNLVVRILIKHKCFNRYAYLVSSAEGASSRKSQFWWDNIVMGTSSNKRPLLTELWDKPFTKRPTSPTISNLYKLNNI